MNTNPPGDFQDHLRRLIDGLRRSVPDIDERQLRCYDTHCSKMKDGHWVIPAADIGDLEALQALVERLCHEGKDWINLVGEGLLPSREYLIVVEYNKTTTGCHPTAILTFGPTLKADGTVRQEAKVIIE